jgi:anti-anti-sigma regulatory factor
MDSADTVPSPYTDLIRIADANTAPEQRAMAMRSFAQELNWVPSYEVQGSFGVESVAGHLIVEHGLENAAAISFLKSPFRSALLRPDQLKALLAVSYNNLIEWHLFISEGDARWVNNLADRSIAPGADRTVALDPGDLLQAVSSSRLDELDREGSLRKSIKTCDDALLQVISRWKLLLKADYPEVENRNLSALFNALIFVRGCEDRDLDIAPGVTRVLLSSLTEQPGNQIDLPAVLKASLAKTGIADVLGEFVDEKALEPFKTLDLATAQNIFRELYAPKDAAYDFNFALMSKHALSRIYEKYVALLRPEPNIDASQLSLLKPIPQEVNQHKSGAIYTPQFVAGFFSRFIRDNLTPKTFRELRSIDPACGSGIFLRNLLELQCDPSAPGITTASITQAFLRTEAIDKDVNACEATRLSLALLHLIATGNLPKASDLRVTNTDAIAAIMDGSLTPQAYGAVMSNPPYVKLDHLPEEDRKIFAKYLGDEHSGRMDAYIPFVRLCLELSQPRGIVCLVLPQTFMSAANASTLREKISSDFDVRCLIDLSAVPVFESVGAYTILLVLQRRIVVPGLDRPPAQIAQVTESVGAALQACLDGLEIKNKFFSVFPAAQSIFRSKAWVLVSPEQIRIDERLSKLPKLSTFMTVAQGFLTGADKVFIRPRGVVPSGEESIYIDYLPDRQIGRYSVPKRTSEVVFFPFEGDRQLVEEEIVDRYPKTWAYLCSHKGALEARKSVTRSGVPWWKPVRSRSPSTLLKPKIVCPHLMLTPRFAINPNGNLAVSHSPFVISKDEGEEQTLIRLFCAVLNSTICNWYIRTYAPKYGRGYNRLEVTLLNAVPVPDLANIDSRTLSSIVEMVDQISKKPDEKLDDALDDLVCGLYGFTATERQYLFGLK